MCYTPADRLLHKIHTAWSGRHHPWGLNMQRLLTQYNIDTSNPREIAKHYFKGHVEARAINYIRAYRTQPPRNLGDPLHTRYMADFGIGELTPRRPKIRTYLRTETLYPHLDECRAAEVFMHFRLETLSLHAFHSHARRRETAATRHMRKLCPSCKQHAETPTHFLLECPAYSIPRSLPHVVACVADAQNSSTPAP
jgi:hypothetical protein